MSNSAIRVYWDSCVFIDALAKTPGRFMEISKVLVAAERKEVIIVTSALTMVEVYKTQSSSGGTHHPKDDQAISDFFDQECFVVRAADRHVAERARRLCQEHKLKSFDAVHLATALLHDVESLHTYDSDLGKLNGKVGSPALLIEPPAFPGPKLPLMEIIKPQLSIVTPHPQLALPPKTQNVDKEAGNEN